MQTTSMRYKERHISEGFSGMQMDTENERDENDILVTNLKRLNQNKEFFVTLETPNMENIYIQYGDGGGRHHELYIPKTINVLFRSKSLADAKAFVDIMKRKREARGQKKEDDDNLPF